MAIIAKNDGKKYTNHPEGQFGAVCCDVVDLGMVTTEWQGTTKEQHKIRVVFWTGEKDPNDPERDLTIGERMTLSMYDRARLRGFLESWRGKKYTDHEADQGIDVEAMIGVPALIQVTHNHKGDKTYANITSIMRLPKSMEPPTVGEFVRAKDRTEEERPSEEKPMEDIENDDSPLPF